MNDRTTEQPKRAPSTDRPCSRCGSPLHVSLFDGASFCKRATCWYRSAPGLGTDKRR